MTFPSVGSLRKNNWDQSAVIHPSMHLVAVIVADSSSVDISWNSSNILFLSGNVERNSEPHFPNENPIHCIICSAKFKQDIQQETAPIWTKTLLVKIPSSLQWFNSCTDTPHKTCGYNILWKCPKHDSGIAEIVVPPPPIFERPTKSSAVGKLCSVCSTRIRPWYANLVYLCADLSCPNVCHLIPTCSGFLIPRGIARQRELATWI